MNKYSQRPFVIIESPYSPSNGRTISENRAYLIECLHDSFSQGETPFASHLFYPEFLDEFNPEERKAGIEMGYAFWPLASKIIFYIDYGWSPGMRAAQRRIVDLNNAYGYTRYPFNCRCILKASQDNTSE